MVSWYSRFSASCVCLMLAEQELACCNSTPYFPHHNGCCLSGYRSLQLLHSMIRRRVLRRTLNEIHKRRGLYTQLVYGDTIVPYTKSVYDYRANEVLEMVLYGV